MNSNQNVNQEPEEDFEASVDQCLSMIIHHKEVEEISNAIKKFGPFKEYIKSNCKD